MADPATIAAGVGAAGKFLGGIGGLFGGGKSKEELAQEAEELAIRKLQGVYMPTLEELKYSPEEYQYLGDLTAAQEEAGQLGPSQMAQIQASPEYKQAQLLALQKLQERGEQGLTATERAALGDIRRGSEGAERSRQQGILQNMAERGAGGSGAELAARLQSSQSEANRASAEGDRLAAMAEQRALEAISQGGALAGNIRGQEFNEESAKAQAADEIARFNLANLQGVRQRNVGSENVARERNVSEKQRISEGNVGGRNTAQATNLQQKIADYERRYGQAGDVADIYKSRAAGVRGGSGSGPSTLSKIGGMVGTAGETIGTLGGLGMFDSKTKKPVPPKFSGAF